MRVCSGLWFCSDLVCKVREVVEADFGAMLKDCRLLQWSGLGMGAAWVFCDGLHAWLLACLWSVVLLPVLVARCGLVPGLDGGSFLNLFRMVSA